MASTDSSRTHRSSFASLFGTSRRGRLVSAFALLLAACAFGAAGVAPLPDSNQIMVRSVVQELPLPTLEQQIATFADASQRYSSEEKIRAGDSLATLLMRLGVDDPDAAAFIKSDSTARKILELRPGKRIQAQIDENGNLYQLTTLSGDGRKDQTLNQLSVAKTPNGFTVQETPAALERRVEMRSGEIRSSLFAATDNAQIPDNVAMQIVEMFSTNIDFASDLRRGDRFNIVYETFWQNGELVQSGRVIAGEFINDGDSYQSVWFAGPDGKQGGYYSMDGKSLKKAFLKSPLEFSRISSGFSMRVHPISGRWKAHKGVDFAAATGTPVRAAGDGIVDFVGAQGGYGNVVVIKHWNNYSTAYAHLSRFASGVRRGDKVGQGELIGYVGSTGWSTGPHLHYEFRVNNEPRDPMSIDLPNAQPLAANELKRFLVVASEMSHRFSLLRAEENVSKLAAR